MNKSLNKSKWPYLLLLSMCMVAASINSSNSVSHDFTKPVIVEVQVEKQPKVAAPYTDWLVQENATEVPQ
ncbi:MAG: hypothetical protein ACPGGA_05790, partial [Balneolaceae bacterium]